MKPKLLAVGIGILGTIVGAYLMWPEVFGHCIERIANDGTTYCGNSEWKDYGTVIFPFGLAFLGSAIFMLIANGRTYIYWMIFTAAYVALSGVALLALPQQQLGGFMTLQLFPIDMVAETLSYLYVALSGLLFLISQHLPRPK